MVIRRRCSNAVCSGTADSFIVQYKRIIVLPGVIGRFITMKDNRNSHLLKRYLLCWFPVIFLPVVNVIIALSLNVAYEPAHVLHWCVAAILEEVFFRWFLLKKILLPLLSPAIAIILDSVLFAGMHLFNLCSAADVPVIVIQLFLAFCFSIWAACVTYRFTFLIPLLAHVLLNLTATTVDIGWLSIIASVVVLLDGILLIVSEREIVGRG